GAKADRPEVRKGESPGIDERAEQGRQQRWKRTPGASQPRSLKIVPQDQRTACELEQLGRIVREFPPSTGPPCEGGETEGQRAERQQWSNPVGQSRRHPFRSKDGSGRATPKKVPCRVRAGEASPAASTRASEAVELDPAIAK